MSLENWTQFGNNGKYLIDFYVHFFVTKIKEYKLLNFGCQFVVAIRKKCYVKLLLEIFNYLVNEDFWKKYVSHLYKYDIFLKYTVINWFL